MSQYKYDMKTERGGWGAGEEGDQPKGGGTEQERGEGIRLKHGTSLCLEMP